MKPKTMNIDRSKLPAPSVLAVSLASLDWVDKSVYPSKDGWYATRTDDGIISWRAWGGNAWWKQLRDGWLRNFASNGVAVDYEWLPSTQRSVELDSWEMPVLHTTED